MTGLSTHDTKRGEDVRARLAALGEVPDEWAASPRVPGATAVPNRAFGYFMAQTLLGVGPIEPDRIHAYAEKAMREASDGTTWTEPDADFEAAVHAAVDLAYDAELRRAWDELTQLVTGPGWANALGQKLVQLTMPGMPDVYQGTEVWEDSLVDPDNRRPVDFARHRSTAGRPDGGTGSRRHGRGEALGHRAGVAAGPSSRSCSTATAHSAHGPAADHLVAYDRGGAITLATRLPIAGSPAGGWGETTVELGGRGRRT